MQECKEHQTRQTEQSTDWRNSFLVGLLQFKCKIKKYNRSVSINLLEEDGIVDADVMIVDLVVVAVVTAVLVDVSAKR